MNVLITGGAGFIGSNLAAQVAVTTSVTEPRIDFEVNTTGIPECAGGPATGQS